MGDAALQALLDHSQKKLEPTAVMRALVQHDGWYVPIHALTRVPTDPVIAYAERDRSQVAPHQLNVFTDRAATDLAAEKFGRAPMGTYVGPVQGAELFGNLVKAPALGPALMMQVNPGSPTELQWFVERNAFGLCEIWANAVIMERKIATTAAGWAEAMKLYPGWLVVLGKTDNALVRINMREKGEHALVFSAPDLADNFLKGLPNNGGSACKTVAVAGEALFKFVLKSGVKGFLVNASSPHTRVFDATVCRMILGLP